MMGSSEQNRLVRRFGRRLPGAGLAWRVLLLALIWLILSGGDPAAWLWGVPAVLLAALLTPVSLVRWRPLALLRFVPVFAWLSLCSAADVARRALLPSRPLEPSLVDYPWRLPKGPARIFLANLINLLPGTLCVEIKPMALTIHVLSNTPRGLRFVIRLERHVAALFGVPLRESADG